MHKSQRETTNSRQKTVRKIEEEEVTRDSLIGMSVGLRLRRIIGVRGAGWANRLGKSDRRIIGDALEGPVLRVAGIGFVMVVDDDPCGGGGFLFLAHFLDSPSALSVSLSPEEDPNAEMDQNARPGPGGSIKIIFYQTKMEQFRNHGQFDEGLRPSCPIYD